MKRWLRRHRGGAIETRSLPALTHVHPPISTCGLPIYVARLPAAPFARSYPRHFTFYVADPISSIARSQHCKHLPRMISGFETRSSPNLLVATLATLPSISLV